MRLRSPETLRALMAQAHLSTRMLAANAGLSHSMIDHLLHGRKDRLTEAVARRVATALSAPFDLLWESADHRVTR